MRLNVLIELRLLLPERAGQPREKHPQGAHNSSLNISRIIATVRAQLAFCWVSCFFPALVIE
jgi:hypothetical protein